MSWKSVLKPEGSIVASLATIGAVYGVYQLNVGNVSQAHATTPNHPVLESSRKKAGFQALVLVAGLTLITKDANIGILGGGAIIAMELSYRHGIMSDTTTGKMSPPVGGNAYAPAQDTVATAYQGETA
jgi:hypothetical protein